MIKIKNIGFIFISLMGILHSYSQSFFEKFKDSTDSALDISYFLKDLNGVLPIVGLITEPAIGFGLAAAGIYFIEKEPDKEIKFQKPDIVGIGGGFTKNSTWFIGGGYLGFWKNDKIRYRGVLGYGDFNLTYYRKEDTPLLKKKEDFNIRSSFFLQQLVFRLHESNFFLGGKYQLSKTNVNFIEDAEIPDIDPKDFKLWNSGLSVIAEFEDLNNVFSPEKGKRIHLSYDQNMKLIGSDKNWGKFNFFSQFYFPVSALWVPALRVESHFVTGDIPFYAKPYIELRGVPALRYQGDFTILAETEHLFNINSRWGIVAFTGMGTTFATINKLKTEELVWNAGGGFRYLIARIFGLKVGVDVARGPEDWAVYMVLGSSWLK